MNSPHPYRTSSRQRASLVTAVAVMITASALTTPVVAQQDGAAPSSIKLTASDGNTSDFFGRKLDLENGIAIVGAPFDDDFGNSSGSAYVFVRDGSGWVEQKKLIPSDSAGGDSFGDAVAISFKTIVVGAPQKGMGRGAAYVFVWNGSNWVQQIKFVNNVDPRLNDVFGWSVAISADTVLVGVPGDEDACPNRFCETGSVHVFVRFNNQWVRQEVLKLPNAENGDQFGTDVAIDGNTAVVGAFGRRAAYVFVRNGSTWTKQATLEPMDEGTGFGRSVAIDGNTIIVAAPFAGDNAPNSGKAYVFVRNGTNWTEQAQLFASDPGNGANFGQDVALNGNKALIASLNFVAAYYFVRNGTTWVEEDRLTAPAISNDLFGQSVALSGNVGLVGAPGDDDACGPDTSCQSGAAYVFPFSPPPQVSVTAVDATASEPGTNTGQFRIARTGNRDDILRVYYEVSGTATPGADYTPLRGFATIAPGRVGRLFRVNPVDNASPEPNETVKATLLPDPGYQIGPGNEAQIVIVDDD